MSFVKHVSITFLTRIVIIALSLASSIITARFLGPVGRGTFAVLGVITGLASQFGMLGFNSANIHFSSQSPASRPHIIGNSLLLSAATGSFLVILTGIFVVFYPEIIAPNIETILVWITVATIPFIILSTLLQNALIGQGSIVTYNVILLISQIAMSAMTAVVLLLANGTIFHLVMGTSIVVLVSTILYFLASTRGQAMRVSFDYALAKRMFGYGIKLYVAQFFYFLLLRSDFYFVDIFRGPHETGLYATAAQFADLILIIPASIGLVVFPRISADPENRLELGKKTIRVTLIITLAVIAMGIALFPSLVRTLFGEAFLPSVLSMNFLWPGIFFMAATNILTYYIASHKLSWSYPVIWAVGASINIILNLIFIPHFGAPAAALNSSITYGIIFVSFLFIYRRMTGARLRDIFIVKKSDIQHMWRQLLHKQYKKDLPIPHLPE